MKKLSIVILLLLSVVTTHAQSSCGVENKAFRSGEFLAYDLYFNWQFVWVTVGRATMSTVMSTYDGKPAYRTSLVTGGNSKLDKFFTMRDTLVSYCSLSDLSPLYYRKGALEGKRYYIDELWYSSPGNGSHIKMHAQHADGTHTRKEASFDKCVYDMMSIFLHARNLDAAKMKKGDIIPLAITSATDMNDSWMEYKGKENYKIEGSNEKFRCLVFAFNERENNKVTELIRFYVTDDDNHMPVRLDMNLSFGSAKAYLRSYKGLRNDVSSKLK